MKIAIKNLINHVQLLTDSTILTGKNNTQGRKQVFSINPV